MSADQTLGPESARAPDAPLRLASELALWLVTVAAIVGMHRLFEDGSYRGALVLQAAVAHLTVALLRRAGVHLVPAAAATAALGALFITWTRFPETVAWGLPTGDTVRALGDDLDSAWSLFGDVSAPAPVENGFVVTTAIAVWVIAFLADWAAFRVGAAFEAVLPATVLFVFSAALGGDGGRVASAALFAACALAFVLLHRTATQMRSSRWTAGQRRQMRWSLVATGAGTIAVAVAVAVAASPHLPGADADAVVDWQNLNSDEPTRYVQSPLVSLQTKLIDQSNVELFTVRSERSAYWRTTALDDFDGTTWKSSYSTDDAEGTLPRSIDAAAESEVVAQDVTIEALSSVWLPAAFEPRAIDAGPDQQVVYDERSATLMVDRDISTSDGYSYTVESSYFDWSADELRAASREIPDDIAERYLALPDGFPRVVGTEAFRVAGDETTPYDTARALQDYLRSDVFTYNVEVGLGESNDALTTFLLQTRQGYCQQFAGAFAAMARSIGLPARLAVGFTPGVQDPNDPQLFRVRGVHAHAWPEVYLGEYGWVPFEPTEGRGPPRAPNWLGVEEQQDTSTGGAAITDPLATDDGGGDDGSFGEIAAGDELRQPGEGLGADLAGAGGDETPRSGVAEAVEDGAPAAGIGIAAYLVLVPIALAVQQLLRRRRARTALARVELGWSESTELVHESVVALPGWLTINEKAGRMAEALPEVADDVWLLAATTERAEYAPEPPTDDEAEAATRARATIAAAVDRRRSWAWRIGRHLDIRLLGRGRRQTRIVTGDVVHGEVVPGNASPGITAS
jgi:transglutaminase-like putative cysteine protease